MFCKSLHFQALCCCGACLPKFTSENISKGGAKSVEFKDYLRYGEVEFSGSVMRKEQL